MNEHESPRAPSTRSSSRSGTTSRAEIRTPAPEADEQRRRGLRRMRVVATGLLLVAALVYVLTLGLDGVWGYVNAGAEASMVGAIADWFAVTALFRHPLGLPIPHTALVPKRKDELGRGLQDFVGDNFLAEEVVREQVAGARIPERVGEWLEDEAHARRVVDEAAEVLGVAVGKVRDEHVADFVTQALVPRFREEPISPLAGTLLGEVVRDGAHHGLVDVAVVELHRWLVANPESFGSMLESRAPWWVPPKVNEAVIGKMHEYALRWLEDIRDDPRAEARLALDSVLAQLAEDLLDDPATQQRAEGLKDRLLDHPQLTRTAVDLWNALRRALEGSLADPHGAVRERALVELVAFGERLREDEALRARLTSVAQDVTVFLVERYGREVTSVIGQTIERWDGEEAASKIELHVGRDLQFIRINGTVVGGLVGLAIHAVSQLLGH